MPSQSRADFLLRRVSNGDYAALEDLLEDSLPPLEAYLRRRAGRLVQAKESVADLVQSVCRETLERVADGRLELHGEEEFRHWLFQAALWKLQNRQDFWAAGKRDVRRELRSDRAQTDRSQAEALFFSVTTPSHLAVREEHLELLDQALEQMPQQLREVLVMARIEGCSHGEIAERLQISETHSRTLLFRALARLSKTLSAKLKPSDE